LQPLAAGESQTLLAISDRATWGHYLILELRGAVSQRGETLGSVRLVHRGKPSTGGGVEIVTQPFARAGGWLHLVAVADGAELRLYVNGRLRGIRAAQNLFTDAADQMSIGSLFPRLPEELRSLRDRRYFTGELDEVAIYNRALSTLEVQQHFLAAVRDSTAKAEPAAASPAGDAEVPANDN
jgi:hypothetical protein